MAGDLMFTKNLFGQAAPSSVGTGDLADNSVTTPKIAPGAVVSNSIAGSAVTPSKIPDNSVPATKIEQVAWTTFTTVWTSSGGVTGGGTKAAAYYKIGRLLTVQIDFTYTGGMTLPAGNYFLDFGGAYVATTTRYQPGVAMYHVAGGGTHYAGTCSPLYAAAGGTKLAVHFHGIVAAWGQNIPVAPAVGDILTMTWTGETTV